MRSGSPRSAFRLSMRPARRASPPFGPDFHPQGNISPRQSAVIPRKVYATWGSGAGFAAGGAVPPERIPEQLQESAVPVIAMTRSRIHFLIGDSSVRTRSIQSAGNRCA